jgi:4-amino-4-deoxy-L-arabinose transferase-like glycosyltransferase
MKLLKEHITFCVILLSYLLLFIPFLGDVYLFDWDEINFAEAAREMLVTDDWLNVRINYEPFWEKPPLFIWLQAISMKIFGVNEFAARFPNTLAGLVTIFLLYCTVFRRYSKQAAVFSVLMYLGSFTSHFYFKSGIIDPVFNLFIFLSILYLIKSIESEKLHLFLWSGIYLGLAVITKGPVAILLVGLSGLVYQVVFGVSFYNLKKLLTLLIGLLIAPGLYFGIEVYYTGWWFLKEFIVYQIDLFRYPIASHGQPVYYHVVVLLIGCFPLFGFAIKDMIFQKTVVVGDLTFYRWMKVLFWVVLIVFSLVTTKIVHYSSMCYIPLSIVGGIWLANLVKMNVLERVLFGVIGMVWVFILSVFGIMGLRTADITYYLSEVIADDFIRAQLTTDVSWSIVPILLAALLLGLLLKTLIKGDKLRVSQFLVWNTLIITFTILSIVPNVEHLTQRAWKSHLSSYQNKEMQHFTLGFKSYAHRYYTQQKLLAEVATIRKDLLNKKGYSEILDLDQFAKGEFDNVVRDYIIRKTNIPVSVSAKIRKFESVEKKYPNLEMVFEGNGYGVWERAKGAGK